MVLAVGALSGGAESFVPPPRYIVCGLCLQNGSTAQDVAKKNRFYEVETMLKVRNAVA